MRKKNGVKVSVVILFVLLAGVFASCAKTEDTAAVVNDDYSKVFKWRMVTHQLPGTARYDSTILPFVKAVEEASNGRLIIEPFGAGVLFPVSESLDNLKNGVVEMSAIWSGYWAGKNPVFALAASIPADPIKSFGEHYYRSQRLQPVIAKAYEKFGVKSLGGFDYGPSEILMSNKPIKSLADFNGITIRTGGIGGEFYAAIGASTVSLSGPEIYQALQLKTVDAAEYNDWIVNSEMGFNEVTKYVIEPVLHTGPIDDKNLLVNPKAWNELPKDLKAIVINAKNTAMVASSSAYAAKSLIAKNKYIEAGTTIITLSDDDVNKAREAASSLLKKYAGKNPECAEFVKIYKEVLNELGYAKEAKNLD